MPEDLALNPPLLTADLPGIGGKIKTEPEDFEVEEIPAYEPSGQGDFLYLWIEKRDMGAEYFQRQVAQRLGLHAGEIGMAGLKDRRAVTRQWIAVPANVESRLSDLDGPGVRVLKVSRHTNKLKPGHLHGNRFRILIRDLDSSKLDALPLVLDSIRQHGMPNYYGVQRFGHDRETLQMGMALVRGETPARRARTRFLQKLVLSAAQSALFNHCLGRRLADGLLRRVLPGDVMAKYPFGGMFVAEDVAREQPRFDAREIVTTGPIYGRKMFPAQREAAWREAGTLVEFGLTTGSFHGFGKLLQGTRRHNLVYVDDLATESTPAGLLLTFTLPAGSYATVLLREIMKCEPPKPVDERPTTHEL
jgi:tRNA pseudouridine13 synthase